VEVLSILVPSVSSILFWNPFIIYTVNQEGAGTYKISSTCRLCLWLKGTNSGARDYCYHVCIG
jgi:hypothetical protein